MKLSCYTIIVDNYPVPGEHLVYHTRTQAMLKVNQELRDLLQDIDAPGMFAQRARYAGDLVQMHEMGVIVENIQEDRQKLADFFAEMKHGINSPAVAVTVLTTMDCNFRCGYCFEESSRQSLYMDTKTCDQAAVWIRKRVTDAGARRLYLTFYGGEPLLNEEAMEYLARLMQAWCAQEGIEFRFMIQTNGYLVTADRVRKYKALGLSEVRISIDGVGAEHDRKRPLRGGGGTFDVIIKNIIENADQIRIGVSVSYDHSGVEHIRRLLDHLEGMGLLHKLGRIICSPVHASLGPAGQASRIRRSGCAGCAGDEQMVQAAREINRILEEKGLPVRKGLPVSACSLGRDHGSVTIDPEGRLYGCNSMIGHPEFSIGDIYQQGFNDVHQNFKNMDVALQCPPACRYLPMCAGGCRLMSFLGTQKFDVPDCRKAYLDEISGEMIKREYDALAG